MTPLLRACALFCLLSPAVAFATAESEQLPPPSTEPPREPPAEGGAAATELELGYDYGIALKAPRAAPSGFDREDLRPPSVLSLSWRQVSRPRRMAFSVAANATFARLDGTPGLGITPGLTAQPREGLFISLELDAQTQGTLPAHPYRDTQFGQSYGSAALSIRYEAAAGLELGLGVKDLHPFGGKIGGFEGLETFIDHNDTYALSPRITVRAQDPPIADALMLQAGADLYFLGAAAIASKEFAFLVPYRNGVTRWGLRGEARFGRVSIQAGYSLVTGVRDPLELAFQAPFLTHDYLLSPQTMTTGASWHF